jgi:hypothetical protein
MVAAVGWQLDAGMVAFADFSDTLSDVEGAGLDFALPFAAAGPTKARPDTSSTTNARVSFMPRIIASNVGRFYRR